MMPMVRRLCLTLLAAASLGPLSGCFGVSQNPSYFPYLLPTGDIIQTHAKPISPGYYANFDPHAIQLVVRPLNATNPVRTQHVLIATVLDEKGQPRRNRRVEWMVEGVGSLIEVDENGIWPGRGYKVDSKYAVSYTEYCEHCVSRGNANPNDDFVLRPGQSWCVISSPVEGDTHVTVCAPGIFDWDKRCVTVTCRWVDAAWKFPEPAVAEVGREVVLTTRVFRHTDQQPLAGYRVRYRLLNDDPPGVFLPTRGPEAVATSDLSGNASVSLVQNTPRAGVNRVGIEVIRPPDPTAPSGSGIVLATGETAVEWLAPVISLSHTGPAFAGVGQDVPYTITVTNTGKLESRFMTVTNAIPEGLTYVSSSPPAVVNDKQLVWTLGKLPPGQAHTLQTVFKAARLGAVVNCAAVETGEGLKDQKCVTTQITQAALKVSLDGPSAGVIGVPVTFRVGVANPGGAPATNVRVRASFDDGLEHESRGGSVEVPLPVLNPGEQRDLQPLVLTPRKTGRLVVRVEAQADGNLRDRTEQAINVQQAQLKVSMAGPKTQYVGLPAEWEIRVSNPGQVPVTGVRLRNVLPPEVNFQSSTEGGQPGAGEVSWDLGTLGPGQQKSVRVTGTCARVAAAAVNRATATAEGGLSAGDQAAVEIVGVAGLSLRRIDKGDPVAVGQRVTYRVEVSNTGSAPAADVEVRVTLPPELQPVAEGSGGPSAPIIAGQVVTFAKVPSLAANAKLALEYTVEALALKKGDVRVRVELFSKALDRGPVVQEEPTTIFEARPDAETRTTPQVQAAPVRAAVPVPLAPGEDVPARLPPGPPPPPPPPPAPPQ
jgi:uncharacterized repeat protein (TIGR01451 family)